MTSTTPRRLGRRRGSDPPGTPARRDAFLNAASTVVRRDGAGASMQAMAREAGVTKPILYREFGDREGLLAALGEQFAGELVAELTQALVTSPAEDPRRILARTIDAYVALIERDPHVYAFLTERLLGAPNQPIAGLIEEISRFISVEIGQRMRAAGGDSGAAEPWAYGLVGMVHLAGDWWVKRQTMPREQLVEYLVALTWDGMERGTGTRT